MGKLGLGFWGWVAGVALVALGACGDDTAAISDGMQDGGGAVGSESRGGTGGTRAGSGGGDRGGAGGVAGRPPVAGRDGAGAGGRGGAGGASGDGGKGGADGGSSGGGDSGKGGGAGSPDDSCSGDGDCVLCILPLSAETPCCDGCPSVMSQARCDAERAAASANCKPGMIPLCPAILCVAPGSPNCEGGMCVSVGGFEQ